MRELTKKELDNLMLYIETLRKKITEYIFISIINIIYRGI